MNKNGEAFTKMLSAMLASGLVDTAEIGAANKRFIAEVREAAKKRRAKRRRSRRQ